MFTPRKPLRGNRFLFLLVFIPLVFSFPRDLRNLRLKDFFSIKGICSPMTSWEFQKRSGLKIIVTGLEHSGTSTLARLVRSAPSVYGAFECGILLSVNPSDLERIYPFFEWLSLPVRNRMWGLSLEQAVEMVSLPCHAHMYGFLRRKSVLLRNYTYIVDKTPRYVYYLDIVMSRAPGVPVVVVVKSIESQYKSFVSRGWNVTKALTKIRDGELAVKKARQAYPGRILIVRYEQLVLNPTVVLRKIFSFAGLRWDDAFLSMRAFNMKLSYHSGGFELPFMSRCSQTTNSSLPC